MLTPVMVSSDQNNDGDLKLPLNSRSSREVCVLSVHNICKLCSEC